MPTPTYDLIESVTLTTSASSVTFSTIPQDYRDLVLIAYVQGVTTFSTARVRCNNDTASNYSTVSMTGSGTASSFAGTQTFLTLGGGSPTDPGLTILQILDYSATDKHKSAITRQNAGDLVRALAERWADTSAINSLNVFAVSDNFGIGSSFSLYGIAA